MTQHLTARPYTERQSNCTRYAFEGCQGDGGITCRNCPGHSLIPATKPHRASLTRSIALAVLSIVFLFSAYQGFSRAERAWALEDRL